MHTVKFIRAETVAEGTEEFFFERPEGFDFVPGQYVELAFIDPPETDNEGMSRCFSLCSIPSEQEIAITTRMRDTAFKRMLKKMEDGEEMQMDGPFGSLTLHKNKEKPAVFVAGGIGITPFLSMLGDAAERGVDRPLTLFYSNRRPEDAPFLSRLFELADANPNFTFVPTMTQAERSEKEWKGERGYITAAMFRKYCSDTASPIWYVAGPAKMVLAMRHELIAAGADEDNIRTEDFSGY